MIAPQREITERTASWMFALGGVIFMVFVAALAVAHYGYGVEIKSDSGKPLAPRDILIFFSVAFVIAPIVSAKGVWMLIHPKTANQEAASRRADRRNRQRGR